MDKTFQMLKVYNNLVSPKSSYVPIQISVLDDADCEFKLTYDGGSTTRLVSAVGFEDFIYAKLVELKRSTEFKLKKAQLDLKGIKKAIRSKERAIKKELEKKEQ